EPGLADPATMNFEAVLAGLPDAVIAVDTELRVVFWNSAAEVLAERSARRAEGRLLKEIFPGDASIVRRLAETLASGESRSEAEALIERADRREVPVSLVTAALFGKDGNVDGAVAVLRDLSRIRQLEAEVRRGETLAAAAPGDASIVRRLAEPLASGESRSEAEALIERADRREVPVSLVTAALFGKDGNVDGAVAVLRDLSRIRQLEAEVRRGETLASAGR